MPATIKPFIAASRVILKLESGDRRDILRQLTTPLVDERVVTDADAFIDDLEAREGQITTVMPNGIALPHARSEAVRRLGLSVGICPDEGVAYGPDPEVRSKLFFCIAVPAFAPTAHMPLLQSLAAFAREQARVEKLLKSRTPGAAAKQLSAFRG